MLLSLSRRVGIVDSSLVAADDLGIGHSDV